MDDGLRLCSTPPLIQGVEFAERQGDTDTARRMTELRCYIGGAPGYAMCTLPGMRLGEG